MQLIAGRMAQEYNRRKSRRGAFWEDRYHATAIQNDKHLARCMTYIDLNMIRAGAVHHPAEWEISGFSEIQKPWQRKGVIHFAELCRLLGDSSVLRVAERLKYAAEAMIVSTKRESAWTEAAGVGDQTFLLKLKEDLGPRGIHRRLAGKYSQFVLRDRSADYFAQNPPRKLKSGS